MPTEMTPDEARSMRKVLGRMEKMERQSRFLMIMVVLLGIFMIAIQVSYYQKDFRLEEAFETADSRGLSAMQFIDMKDRIVYRRSELHDFLIVGGVAAGLLLLMPLFMWLVRDNNRAMTFLIRSHLAESESGAERKASQGQDGEGE
jgi:hypothetical protein